jgi:hypothetical protein
MLNLLFFYSFHLFFVRKIKLHYYVRSTNHLFESLIVLWIILFFLFCLISFYPTQIIYPNRFFSIQLFLFLLIINFIQFLTFPSKLLQDYYLVSAFFWISPKSFSIIFLLHVVFLLIKPLFRFLNLLIIKWQFLVWMRSLSGSFPFIRLNP